MQALGSVANSCKMPVLVGSDIDRSRGVEHDAAVFSDRPGVVRARSKQTQSDDWVLEEGIQFRISKADGRCSGAMSAYFYSPLGEWPTTSLPAPPPRVATDTTLSLPHRFRVAALVVRGGGGPAPTRPVRPA